MSRRRFIVDAALDGQRLDKALTALLPEVGLRARRRLWERESGEQVLVNDRPRPPGYTVALGDSVELHTVEGEDALELRTVAAAAQAVAKPVGHVLPVQDSPRFLEARDGLLFFHKPAGLHSVALPGGRGGASLEDCLASLVPAGLDTPALHLLNRLDYGTSGLMVAAGDADAAMRWHEAEEAGQCRKTYLTLLTGTLTSALTVTRALDTHHRRVTRVLRVKKPSQAPDQVLDQAPDQVLGRVQLQGAKPAPDLTPDPAQDAPPLRHTFIQPVLSLRAGDVAALLPCPPASSLPALSSSAGPSSEVLNPDQPLTLALCRIRKGVRHQIRAHAAHAGFPLWGDARYGGGGEEPATGVDGHFVLHHGLLEVPGGPVFDVCPWFAVLPEKIANDITQSLKVNNFLS